MAKENETKYWSVSALIANVDSESTMTMKSFVDYIESKCPYKDGWRVVQRETTPMEQQISGSNRAFLPYMTYHLERQ